MVHGRKGGMGGVGTVVRRKRKLLVVGKPRRSIS